MGLPFFCILCVLPHFPANSGVLGAERRVIPPNDCSPWAEPGSAPQGDWPRASFLEGGLCFGIRGWWPLLCSVWSLKGGHAVHAICKQQGLVFAGLLCGEESGPVLSQLPAVTCVGTRASAWLRASEWGRGQDLGLSEQMLGAPH